jgi:bacillithiol synthase
LNLEIKVATVGGGSLVSDYIGGEPRLGGFYAGSPYDAASYRAKADEVRRRFDPRVLANMAGAVRPLSGTAAEKLRSVAGGRGFFVTTGQQPGLFGGPLYTIYKALSALALAACLERILELPVLPVFWVASDDHDWDEANHTYLLDPANVLRRVELSGAQRPSSSMGRRVLDGSAETALDEVADILPPSEFTPGILERLRGSYAGGRTVAGAFLATLEGLFDGLPLGVVDGQDPVVRELGAPIVRRELERAAEHEERLREQTERLEGAGYQPQVAILEGASNVFYEHDAHGRERLIRENGGWLLRSSGTALAAEELWALWQQDPGRFSPNVVLRPVVESAVFPTLCYVAGPGEVRYLAQTKPLFDAHGIGMPVVFPRLGVLLVEGKVRKVLDKFGLAPDTFHRPVHELIASVVREDVPAPVQAALARLREGLQSGYEELHAAAREVDPTLRGPVFHGRNDALRGLSEVDKRIRQAVKAKHQTELDQIEKAATNLAPLGKPQERVLNVHQYLSRYGSDLLGAVLERMEAEVSDLLGLGSTPAGVPAAPGGSRTELA